MHAMLRFLYIHITLHSVSPRFNVFESRSSALLGSLGCADECSSGIMNQLNCTKHEPGANSCG